MHGLHKVAERGIRHQPFVRPTLRRRRRLAHEQDPIFLGVVQAEPHVGVRAQPERFEWIVGSGRGLLQDPIEAREVPLAYREDQFELVGEVQVDRWRGHPDLVRHGTDGDLLHVSRPDQQALGSGEDLLPEALALAAPGPAPP